MTLETGPTTGHRTSWWQTLACVAVVALPAAACRTVELNPDDPVLRSLSFEGNHAFSRGDLEAGLVTETGSWWPFTRRPRFDPATFQGDVDRIVTFYKARGYFDARILDVAVKPHGKDGVDVTVKIDEGKPFATRSLAIDGSSALPLRVKAVLARPFDLRVAKIFTEDDYQKTKAEILTRVQEYAYAAATVEGLATVDRNAQAVDVTFRLVAGAHYKYGALDIVGNHRVSDKRILKEINGVLKSGDDYRASDLETARLRLHELGVFGNVEIRAGKPDPATSTIPVVVSVAEAPFQALRAGGGIGIDVEHEEAHVSAGYTDRDFLGNLRRLDFDNTFALEWLPNIFNPEFGAAQPAFTSTLKLTQPAFFGRGFDLETSLQGQREVEIGYADWAIRGRVAVPMKLTRKVTFTAAYNAEVTFFDSGSSFNGLSLTPAALLQLGNPDHTGPYVLSYLEEAVTLDLRDDPVEPRRGLFANLTVQEAGGPLLGDFSNVRFVADAREYVPFGTRDVLAARLELGSLFTYAGTTSPIDQRFFLGGLDSVRGYGSLRLSPVARVNTCGPRISGNSLCTTPSSSIGIVDVPIGGNGMAEASLELRHKLSELFGGVAFVDMGEVTGTGVAVTPGLGLRIHTPVGPIRIDVAYLVIPALRQVTVVTQTFGNQATGNYPIPNTSAGGIDSCGWPFVPQTGWGGPAAGGGSTPFAQPSACKSPFLQNLALSIAIGEAF
jgi:translocation and assembly module TamA